MTKSIQTSTYMEINDVVHDALNDMYASTRSREYRVLVMMALKDFVRNAAHDIPEEKAIKLIDEMNNRLLQAAAATVLAQE